jgi:WD40 repeat protein
VLASAGRDGYVTFWDLQSGHRLRKIDVRRLGVRQQALAFARNGRTVVVGTNAAGVKQWDVATGQEYLDLAGQAGGIVSLACRADGRTLAFVSGPDRGVRLWDLAAFKEVRTLPGPAAGFGPVAVLPGERRMITADGEGTLQFWDLGTGTALRTAKARLPDVMALAVSGDGKHLAVASTVPMDKQSEVVLWDAVSGEALLTFPEPAALVASVQFAAGSKLLVSGDDTGTIKVWDVSKQLERLAGK